MASISATVLNPSCTKPIPRPTLQPLSSSLCASNSSFFNSTFLFHRSGATHRNPVLGRASTKNKKKGFSCTCLFGLGVPELVVIAGVAALVFGPKQLPEVGRSIGKTVKSFQQAAKEFESELKKEPDSAIEPPVEKPVSVSGEAKQETTVSE